MGAFKQILIEAEKELEGCIDGVQTSVRRLGVVNDVRVEMHAGKPGAVLSCYLDDGVTPNKFQRDIIDEYGRGVDISFKLLDSRTIEVFFPLSINKGSK